MEELQSTDALDREILEDARKKAFKILKAADDTMANSALAWDRKLEKVLEETRKTYAERAEHGRMEIMARLPMDKRRVRSEKIEGLLSGAMSDFLSSLDRKQILQILEKELLDRAGECKDEGNCDLRYRGLSKEELDTLVKKVLPAGAVSVREDPLYGIPGKFPAIVLDFPALRITASVDRAAAALLADKRAELVTSLLGEAALLEGGNSGGSA